jgi:outer membrane protein TolC
LWIETLLAATDAKYRAGQSSLTELVLLQNELSRRTNQLRTDEQWLGQARVEINRMLNRPEASPLPVLRLPDVAAPVVPSEKLVALSLRYEPKSKMMREQIRQAESMVEFSRKARYPDVGLDLEGRNYTGNGDFRQGMFLAKFSVPLGNAAKYRKDIERDRERAAAARLDLVDQELDVRREIHQSIVSIDAARREALLYQDEIIPRTEQALAGARSLWEGGRGNFRDLLDARRMLLEARLMQARAVAAQWQALSDLVLCCGLGDLEALLMLKDQLGAETSTTASSAGSGKKEAK